MLSREWLSICAPVGKIFSPDRFSASGACVFIHKPPFIWLVTAHHVVAGLGDQHVSVLINRNSGLGSVILEIGKIIGLNGISWVRDKDNDLAAAPLPLMNSSEEFAFKSLPLDLCLSISELMPSMPSFTVGCPYGLAGFDPQRDAPLVLNGVISGLNVNNNRIYTSAPTFSGNSGGPLVVFRSQSTPGGQLTVGLPTILLAGIMLSTEIILNNSGSPIPALHLGAAASTDAIRSLLDSPSAKEIENRFNVKTN